VSVVPLTSDAVAEAPVKETLTVPENPGALNRNLSPIKPALTSALTFGSMVGIVFTSEVVAAGAAGAINALNENEATTQITIETIRLRFTTCTSRSLRCASQNQMNEGYPRERITSGGWREKVGKTRLLYKSISLASVDLVHAQFQIRGRTNNSD
jgi:hypothetical protein